MSENVATVMAIYEAFGRGDVAAIVAQLAPDVAWDQDSPSFGIPFLEPRTGRDEVLAFFAALNDNVVIHRLEPKNVLTGGDQVAVVMGLSLEAKATGRTVDDQEIHLWTFNAAGQVSRFAHVVDRHATLCALRGVEP